MGGFMFLKHFLLKKIVILFLFFSAEDNLLRKAKGMLPEIGNFLKNPGVIKPLPKGNDQHLIPTLLAQKEQDICDEERDCLSNYLCLSFEKLRDHSKDVASLLHATIDFISKYQPGKLLLYTVN